MKDKEDQEQLRKRKLEKEEDSTVSNEKRQKSSADSQRHPPTHQNTNPSKRKRKFFNDVTGKRSKGSDNTLINFYNALEAELSKIVQAEKIINFANYFNKIPFDEQASTRETLASIIILFKDILAPIFQSFDTHSRHKNLIANQYLEKNKKILQELIANILRKIYEFRDNGPNNKKWNDYSKTIQAFELLKKIDLCSVIENKEILEHFFIEISQNFEQNYPQHFLIPLFNLCRLLDQDIKCIDSSVVTLFKSKWLKSTKLINTVPANIKMGDRHLATIIS